MRTLALFVLVSLAACAHATIPGTRIPDEPRTRAILDVLGKYKAAMEARDSQALLALAAPSFFDPGDAAHPSEPHDFEGLKKQLPRDFANIKALRLEITVKDVKVDNNTAAVDYFAVLRYAVAAPSGEKWFSESDDQRMPFVKVGGDWKIASKM